MEQKKVLIAMGGAALVALGSVAAAVYFRSKSSSPVIVKVTKSGLTKEQVLIACKEVKSQIFSTALQIIEKRNSIQKQVEAGAQIPNQMNVEEYVEEIGSQFFGTKQRLVCQKFDITVEQLKIALEEDFVDDEEIQTLQRIVEQTFMAACAGVQPDLTVSDTITAAFPPAQIALLHIKFFRLASGKYIKAFQEIKKEGEVQMSFENPKFLKKIRDLKIPDAKRQMLLAEGLGANGDVSPREVFDKLTQKYKLADADFNQGIQLYENQFSQFIDQLAENPDQFNENTPESIFPVE